MYTHVLCSIKKLNLNLIVSQYIPTTNGSNLLFLVLLPKKFVTDNHILFNLDNTLNRLQLFHHEKQENELSVEH